jgi:hypothetical protein
MKPNFTQTNTYINVKGSKRVHTLTVKMRSNSLILNQFLRKAKTIVCIIVFLFGSYIQVFGQSPYTSVANGNWNSDATWSGTGTPVAGDVVNIAGGFTVTVTANAACASLTFPATATTNNLNINSGITLTVSGSITIPRSSTGMNSLAVGAGFLNAGSVTFTSGGITNRHQITISTGTATISGDVTQTGSSGSASIIFSGSGTLNLGGAFLTDATGTLTTVAGCTVNYNGAAQTVGNFVYNNLTLSGSGSKTTTGATVNGILSMEGTATTTGTVPTYGASATLQYKGTAAQTTGTEFPATFSGSGGVIINNSNGVTLGAGKTISRLTLTAGILNTSGANLLTLTNTSTTAISGGSTTSFINGPVRWTLPASLGSGSTYNFPVGKGTTYLPFSLVNPTTGTGSVTAQVEAFTASTGGTFNATLTSLSTSEYWSLTTAGNFTNSSVSVTRQTAIAPLDAIGGSATLTGQYVSLAGTAGSNGVTGSNAIGTNRFFVLAQKAAALTTYTSVAPGGNWNTAATWSPAAVPTAGSNVIIASGAPVVLNSNTASLVDLTINGTLDVSTFTVSGTGTLTVNGTSSLLVGGTANFPSGFATTTINTGSVVNYYAAVAQTISAQTYSNLTLSGSGAKTTTGATVNGILSMEGTATTSGTVPTYGASATLQYIGTGAQTTGTEFPVTFTGSGGLIINNSNGVTLGAAKTISRLTLTAGRLTTSSSNLLTINNTGTTGISGGSTTSFINGPVRWTLPASLSSGSTYDFPIGKGTTYMPFSLVNPTTGSGSVTAQVEVFLASAGGTTDVTLNSLSTTEYWSLVTVGNFTNSSVSLTRQTPISPYDVIGGSATLAGIYTSLSGNRDTYSVTSSNSIGTNRYFVFANATAGFTSVPPGGNWNTPATWDPAGVPTAGLDVVIASGAPVTVNVNTATIGSLTINSTLDVGMFTVSGNGTLFVSAPGTLLIGGPNNFPTGFSNSFDYSSTVNYNSSGSQSVTAATYGNLTLSNGGAKILPGSPLTVNRNLTVTGSATVTPTVAITVGGTTTLSGTGVLTLGAANILSNTGSIILSGGTLRTGSATGYSETVGTLTLSNSSTIALGTGVHSITFANSSGVTWNGTTLTITGWTGTPGLTGTGGRIFFGSTSGTLTDSQLAKISFTGYPGAHAILLNTGEIVPASYPNLAITGTTNHGGSCIGIAAAPITYTITNTGGTADGVTVTSDNPQFVVSGSPISVAGGGTATFDVTFTPSGIGAQTATITVASTTLGSNSPTSSLTGSGNDFPTAGLSSSDPDNSICEGDEVTFTATGGTSYEFFLDGVSQGAASATDTYSSSTLTNGQSVTVRVTNANGCYVTSSEIITYVFALPATPVISGTPTVIVGSTTLLGSIYGGGVWTSSDPTKATVNSSTGLVTGIAAGTTTITYTVTNTNGCTNTDDIVVTVLLSTGIEDVAGDAGLLIRNYPNPFAGNTTIRYTLPTEGHVTITIRNLSGQMVKTFVNETEPKGEYTFDIETGDLQPGIYIATLSLKNKGNNLVKTLVLVKGK